MSHRPKKKWGQNFLRNRAAVTRIVDALDDQIGTKVVEIGPGEGVLTDALVERGHTLQLIEIDPDLAGRLKRRLDGRAEVVLADATDAPLPEEPFCAIGNLPYNAATPIVRRVLASPLLIRAVFMVQKEVAARLTATPGDGDYGYLTIYRQLYSDARVIMTLGPGSFHPPPKVDSAVVRFDPRPAAVEATPDEILAVASGAFASRRQTLLNNLSRMPGLDRASARQALESAEIEPARRAETLSLNEFDRLTGAIGARRES